MTAPPDWTLIVCGGGSGGHLFPALAVIEELQTRPHPPGKILFFTGGRQIEDRILAADQGEQIPLPAVTGRDLLRRPWSAGPQLMRSVRLARRVLQLEPQGVVLGTGGFGSVPGVLAAWRERWPVVLLEQNVIPGHATTTLARIANIVCTSFDETSRFLPRRARVAMTGNPVRRAIAGLSTVNTALQVIPEQKASARPTLFLSGGSQGTHALNDAMVALLSSTLETAMRVRALLKDWRIIHQSGERDCPRVREAYEAAGQTARVEPFFPDMPSIYREASVVISRAGATSLEELACAGLPVILVPYPGSARDHQRLNARWYADRDAAVIVEQTSERFSERLWEAMLPLLSENGKRQRMARSMANLARPEAARRVADQIDQIRAGSVE